MDANAWSMLLEGAWTTLWISAVSIAIGVTAGLAIALIRLARLPVIEQLLVTYISLARATPLVTLTLFIFLTLPTFGINMDRSVAGIMALTLNTTAFNAEIWRAAFQNFSRDQREAALACGMTPTVCFRRIMLPQMVITSLPGLVNEMSFLIKGSPAIAVIGIVDLTRVTNR
ncbi:amino acid ABC transporter permease, partial [Halomonas sp. BBD48]|nr:amino acid ABC transporter permease [Halomonas sp. BBD48]